MSDDEIIGAEPEPGLGSASSVPDKGRHRLKKWCLAGCLLLLLIGAVAVAMLASGGSASEATDEDEAIAAAADAAADADEGDAAAAAVAEPGADRRRQLLVPLELALSAATRAVADSATRAMADLRLPVRACHPLARPIAPFGRPALCEEQT